VVIRGEITTDYSHKKVFFFRQKDLNTNDTNIRITQIVTVDAAE